eukprot:15459573-Alexandrium_andersonii.AAC.1
MALATQGQPDAGAEEEPMDLGSASVHGGSEAEAAAVHRAQRSRRAGEEHDPTGAIPDGLRH